MLTLESLECRALFSAAPGDVGPDPVPQFQAEVVVQAPAIVDIDRDGADDLLVVRNRRLQLYMNDGAGAFTKTSEIVFGGPAGKIAVGEFVTAGETSIAAAGSWTNAHGRVEGVLRVLRFNAGASRFEIVDRRAMPMFSVGFVLAANTFGDGLDEIVIGGTQSVADSGLNAVVYVARVVNGVTKELTSARPLGVQSPPFARFDGELTAITAADASGDGQADLAVGVYSYRNETGSVVFIRSTSSRSAGSRSTVLASPIVRFTSLGFAQAAGGADLDIVAAYEFRDLRRVSTLPANRGAVVIPQLQGSWLTPVDTGIELQPVRDGFEFGFNTIDSNTILSLQDVNADGLADIVLTRHREWEWYYSHRQLVYYQSTWVHVALSGGGGWTGRTAWSRNFAAGNVYEPGVTFGMQPPPVIAGFMRFSRTDTETRLVGSLGRTVFAGQTLSEIFGM